MTRDAGARNLVRVFLGVWSALACFYSYLAYRSLNWSPSFFIQNAGYEQARPLAKATAEELALAAKSKFARHPGVLHGRELFRRTGCTLCHGAGGRKGMLNKNYTKDGRTPQLSILAEKLLLYAPEDVEAVLPALVAGKNLEDVPDLDLPSPARVVAKYRDTRKLILNGNKAGKKDPKGEQPINMPAWKEKLTPEDANHIIAYLLTLYPWEEG